MTERDEIDVLAGEYVLGTLDADERAEASVRRRRDPALNAAIEAWEQRLAPLADTVPPVAAPEKVWAAIATLANGRVGEGRAQIVAMERRAQAWRRAAIAASSLAACCP